MSRKSDLMNDTLTTILAESADIEGLAIVGVDGLIFSANVPQRELDQNLVGASSAAVLGLSKRSAGQLKRGDFQQTLIQSKEGNIIVRYINNETLLVGLTTSNVNLGMAFYEMRGIAKQVNDILVN